MVRKSIPYIAKFIIIAALVVVPQLLVWQHFMSASPVPSAAFRTRLSVQKHARFELPAIAVNQFVLAATQIPASDLPAASGNGDTSSRRYSAAKPPATVNPPIELPLPKQPPVWLSTPIDPPEPYCPPCGGSDYAHQRQSVIVCPMDVSLHYLCAM